MGRGVPRRRRARNASPTTGPRAKWTSGPAVLPIPLRGDAARPARSCRAATPPTSTRSPRTARAHQAPEELRLGYVAVHPGQAPAGRCRPTAGAAAARRRRARRPHQATSARTCADAGAPSRSRGSTSPTRATRQPAASSRRRRSRGRSRRTPPRSSAGCRRPSWSGERATIGRPAPGRPTTTGSTWSRRRRVARVGRRARAAARRGARATAPTRSRCRCRPACRRPPWRGCATTRTAFAATWPGRCRASRRRRPGSAPGSTPGSRPRFGQQQLLDPDELPGRGDADIDDDADLPS